MDPTNEEIFRMLKELIDTTERKHAARHERRIQVIDSWFPTGGATNSSSTSTGSDVCGVTVVPTPASSDSDAKLVTIDVGGPAAPAWTTCSTGEPIRNTTKSSSAPAQATAPTVHMATVDIVRVLAAPSGTDGNLDGQAISGAPSTPATCSTVCLPRHPVAVPVLVVSPVLALTECVLDTNTIQVAMVPLAVMGEISEVFAPMDSAPVIQFQQLYSVSELFSPSACQRVTNKVLLHRPMPWPSLLDVYPTGDDTQPLPWPSFREIKGCQFLNDAVDKASWLCNSDTSRAKVCVQPNGDDTRPLPWPSFMEDYDCETPSEAIMKPFQWCSSDSLRAEGCVAVELQISDLCGNLLASTGYSITHDLCNPSEWRCLGIVLLILEYWGSAGDYVLSAHTKHTTLVRLSCTISGFNLRVIVRRLELKLVPIGSVFITFLTVLVDSSNVPALTCAYFGVDSTVSIGSWLIAGWHQELYCSSFSCDTVCESILAPTIFSFVGANLICFSSAEVCALLVELLRSGARIKSEMSKDAGTHATNVIIAVGISHSSTVRSRFGTGHAGLFQGFILMCWLQEQLLATWPPPIASCSVPKNMFLNAELSTLVICEFLTVLVTGINMHTRAASIRRLLLIGYVTVVPFLNLVKVLVQPKKQHSELVYVSGRCLEISSVMFHMIQNILNYMLQHWDSCRPKSAMTHLQPTIPGMYLCLSACIRTVGFVLCKMCSLQMLRPHKCMHGNSTTTECVKSVACPNDVLYPQTLFLLSMHLLKVKCKEQVAVHNNCPTDRQLDPGTKTAWYFGSSQSLICEAYWKQFYEQFSQNLYFDRIFLRAHKLRPTAQGISTDLLNCELFEESCCLVWISSDLHTSVSLADSGSLGWGCQEAVFYETGSELPLHLVWKCSSMFYDSKNGVTEHQSGYEFVFLPFDEQTVSQEGSYAMIPLIRGDPGVCKVALSAASQEVQLHIPWDPGGSELLCLQLRLGVKPCFKEGGVSGTLPIPRHGPGLGRHWSRPHGLGPFHRHYKYEAYHIEKTIQMDHDGTGSFPVLCFSAPLSLLLCSSSPIPC